MQRVIPALRMTDYERSKKYYVDGLGFQVDWEHRFEPGFPVFAAISRDAMQIYLSEHAGDCQVGGLVHFYVDKVHPWYEEFLVKGVAITEPPCNDLGFWMMTLTDPDGNQLRFCEIRKYPTAPEAKSP